MEFSLRPYTESDAAPCGECLYEGFFTGPIDENDRRFLREYAQVLIEKCNFTYVAETEAGQVVGFVCGKYSKPFSPALANRYETKKHYGLWCRMFFQFYLKRYPMSPSFQRQFGAFYQQMRERRQDVFGACDLELVALSSKAAPERLGDGPGHGLLKPGGGGRGGLRASVYQLSGLLGIL